MYQNEDIRRHMYGNPRNIKRIFNIISLTASVIRAIQERVSCHYNGVCCAEVDGYTKRVQHIQFVYESSRYIKIPVFFIKSKRWKYSIRL